jgi:fatty acid CoA ligase FadD9
MDDYAGWVGARLRQLVEADAQIAAALPDPALNEAKRARGLGLAQIVATCMEGYAERPALAERAVKLSTDPATGRTVRTIGKNFETTTYGDLWERTRQLASYWYHDSDRPLRADEFLCILAFGSVDFVTVDLAAIHNGVVVVPLQANAALQQSLSVYNEVAPSWLAVSLDYIDVGVSLMLEGHRPRGLLVFDYRAEVDHERERLEAARARLAAVGLEHTLVTLAEASAKGAALPKAPIFNGPDTAERLCTIYYTSGSTGLPKGAMLPERMIKQLWLVDSPLPMINLIYMPMNHTSGRSIVFSILGLGGTGYFTGSRDLSELFEDMRACQPTYMLLVPRVCEMIYQQYKVLRDRRLAAGAALAAVEEDLLRETRENLLGGRVLVASFASAPLAPELAQFMNACLGFEMGDNYGATEVSAVLSNNRIMRPPILDYRLDDVPELGYFKTDKPHPRGELLVKTTSIMLGYYKRPEATAAVFDSEGYYKTGDIMKEVGPDHLVYIDRRNNVLKLAQGEFVAIALLEAVFTNGDPLIRQAYLYGASDRSFLVGVLVPDEAALQHSGLEGDPVAIKQALREAIQRVAQAEKLQSYEVPRDFIVEREPFSAENGLLAGIGKYQRPKFKERYGLRLEQLYEQIADNQQGELDALRRQGGSLPVLETITRAMQATLGVESIDDSGKTSFSDLGGDSLSAVTFSLLLEEIYGVEVPVSVINNPAGSLQRLARFIERARKSPSTTPSFSSVHGRDSDEIRASDLTLDRFIDSRLLDAAGQALPPATDARQVFMTGANGFLGRFLCLEWLERMARVGGKVVCIARGRDADDARQRIAAAFASDPELTARFDRVAETHLEVLAGDLGEPQLGLTDGDWMRLAHSIDLIVHPAALVNHVLPYPQLFGPNVVGTAEVIKLAITHKLKPINNVSTVAVAFLPDGTIINETADVRQAAPVRRLGSGGYADGYAASKWAAEVLLREAHDQYRLPVAVFRSDMILAHSQYKAQLNMPDVFTRLIISLVYTGLAPKSFYSGGGRPHYPGLPVDFTAGAIATLGARSLSGFRTYHVINPHDDNISLDTIVDWLEAAGYAINRIDDYSEWYDRFASALRGLPEDLRQQTSLPLLQQLQNSTPSPIGLAAPCDEFCKDIDSDSIGGCDGVPHLSKAYIYKYLSDLNVLKII